LSRDRIIARKRNKLTLIAVAGALSMATAGTAAAAAWPAARSANTAFTRVTIPAGTTAASHPRAQGNYLTAEQAQAIANRQAMLMTLARLAAAARKAAAAQAARQKTAAELAATQAAARRAAAQRAAARQAAAQQAASQQTAMTAPAASGSAQNIAMGMLASFGWSSSQFACLQPLWAGESGWSVSASNPNTGAYGIPQALPGEKMASAGPDWQGNAATQIRWGLGYIRGTYGSPCAAWSHEQSTGWY
jgi:hypothetical protein